VRLRGALVASLIAARLPADQQGSAGALAGSVRHYRTLAAENRRFDALLQQARAQAGPGRVTGHPALPVLVIGSDAMRDFPPGLQDEIARHGWQGNQEAIARGWGVARQVLASGHYLHIEQPGPVVQALAHWREAARSRLAPVPAPVLPQKAQP
jgi:pimeloyl-ACP methyl ester carboxylesterase